MRIVVMVLAALWAASASAQQELPPIPAPHRGSENIADVAFSPDGKRLVFAVDDKLHVWDASNPATVRTLAGQVRYCGRHTLAFSPDGQRLAGGDADGLGLWSLSSGKRRSLGEHRVTWTTFSPEGKTLAGGQYNPTLWDAETAKERSLLQVSESMDKTYCGSFAPDGKLLALATSHASDNLQLWDPATAKLVASLAGHQRRTTRCFFVEGGSKLVSAGGDKTISVWDVAKRTRTASWTAYKDGASDLMVSADGKVAASIGLEERVIRIWDVAAGKERSAIELDSTPFCLALSPDGTFLAASSGRQVRRWDLTAKSALVRTMAGHDRPVSSIVFLAGGKRLASGTDRDPVRIWDAESGKELKALEARRPIAASADGKLLAAGGPSVTVFDSDGQQKLRLDVKWPIALAIPPDGRRLATGGAGDSRLWNMDGGKQLAVLSFGTRIAFSPDGKLVAIGHSTGVTLHDAASGEQRDSHGRKAIQIGVAFSPDGQLLVYSEYTSDLVAVDLASKQERGRIQLKDDLRCFAFSPDGKRLALGTGGSQSLRIWSAETWKETAALPGHPGGTLSVAFSPDGKLLATGGQDRTVRLWQVPDSK